MKWVKRGRVFAPAGDLPWAASHAALPCVEPHGDGRVRVYFASRDRENRAQVGSLVVDPRTAGAVHNVESTPVLDLGPLGAFDDHGVNSSCVVHHEGRTFLYYTGWTLGRTVPFYFYVGVAVRERQGAAFRRVSLAPILERSAVDPYLTASPSVLIDEGVWRMWYTSGVEWRQTGGGIQHRYHIKYAESADGFTWHRTGRVCIDFASGDEYAIARPCVVRDRDAYRMWYCYRGRAYGIGYAESADGLTWTRRDDLAGIDVSPDGWDSEMVAYPFVFDHAGARYMLYNGNGYGRTGFGLAEAQG